MKKITIICDGCCQQLKSNDIIKLYDGLDLCKNCIKFAVENYIKSRKKPLRSECKKCNSTGRIRIIDEAMTCSATCGENRTQYKSIICTECEF